MDEKETDFAVPVVRPPRRLRPRGCDSVPWKILTEAWHRSADEGSADAQKAIVVFTDVDGTLVDDQAHSRGLVREALDFLADRSVPLVLCSSRTRAEIELIQQALRLRHPFVSENGGAVYLPHGYFPSSAEAAGLLGYEVRAFGKPYHHVVEALRRTSEMLKIEVRSFSDMSVHEVAIECGVSLAKARLAKLREYDEPFRILDSAPVVQSRLFSALRRVGLRCFTGGRFHHVTAGADKAQTIRVLTSLYRQAFGETLTIGVWQGFSDASPLREVDIAVVVLNPAVDAARLLRMAPTARVSSAWGIEGWSEGIFSTVSAHLHAESGGRG